MCLVYLLPVQRSPTPKRDSDGPFSFCFPLLWYLVVDGGGGIGEGLVC